VDLNHLFLFLAVVSPLLVLARARRPGRLSRAWWVASFIVLIITAVSWVFFPDLAGFIGGGAWFGLFFVPAIGLRKVTELTAKHRYKPAQRLAVALQVIHPSAELREQVRFLRALESDQSAGTGREFVRQGSAFGVSRRDRHDGLRNAPAVVTFIVLNIAAFIIEISIGNWNDFVTLHRLGALEPSRVVVMGEYWRLFTALFLHAGVTHLFFNLFALYVLGPGLERAVGSVRFAICYLVSGIGSSAGVVALWTIGLTSAGQVVGASGCVMGIVGAWAGFLLEHRHAPRAQERLRNILIIIGIQIAFDLTTPQVSTAAHICGLVTGFIIGLLVARRKTSAP
jgi:membrane associated rhomboid family serine protease